MKTTVGWIVFIGCLGMMAGLMSTDIAALSTWDEVYKPAFASKILGHFAVVITSFIAGKIIPEDRSIEMRTRSEDKVDEAKILLEKAQS